MSNHIYNISHTVAPMLYGERMHHGAALHDARCNFLFFCKFIYKYLPPWL